MGWRVSAVALSVAGLVAMALRGADQVVCAFANLTGDPDERQEQGTTTASG